MFAGAHAIFSPPRTMLPQQSLLLVFLFLHGKVKHSKITGTAHGMPLHGPMVLVLIKLLMMVEMPLF